MQHAKIFVATPLGKNGMLHVGTAGFCSAMNMYPNVDWGYTQTSTAEMSRNVLIEKHLKENPDTTHFLFLDSDVVPPFGVIQRMLAFDENIVTGPTPIYFDGQLKWNVMAPDTDDLWIRLSDPLPEEPFYTEKTGFGVVMVKRCVLEDIGWPWFHMEYKEMGESNVALKTGEDIWFCLRAKDKGYKILADPETQCEHHNQVPLMEIYNSVARQIEERSIMLSRFASHWDVLSTAVLKTDGSVVELGCGNSSTNKLKMLCKQVDADFYSYETDEEWSQKFDVTQKIDNYLDVQLPDDCGVLFVDCAPEETRKQVVEKFADKAEIIVIHDTEDSSYGLNLDIFTNRFDDVREKPWTTAVSNMRTLDFFNEIIPQEKVAVDGIND